MNLTDYMRSTRARISERIENEIKLFSSGSNGRGTKLGYVFPSLIDYCLSGKMLRGALVCLGSALFNPRPEPSDAALDIAAAMELFQSGLLIHDDIMDKDDTRRGQPTMHRLLEKHERDSTACTAAMPQAISASSFAHLGESLGICVGDICYFIAWKLINKHSSEIGTLVSCELVDVCLAQMRDVRIGTFSDFPSLEEILEVYAYKTARYTITLPLCCGALLEHRAEAIPRIEDLGLNLGILFQLQDDYLGLFGNENELGKPIGSDLKEGKKTPFMILLQAKMTMEEKAQFALVFGNEMLGMQDIDFVRNLVRRHGVDAEVRRLTEAYADKARSALAALEAPCGPGSPEAQTLLRDFIDYSLTRTF